MVRDKTILERSFELAQSGTCASVADVRKRLKVEGFIGHEIESHMTGPRLRVQLLDLCRQARKQDAGFAGV